VPVRIALEASELGEAVATFTADLAPCPRESVLRWHAPTGALVRIDGRVAGAFDREHAEVAVAPSNSGRRLTLELERHSLPTNGLPFGPGLLWTWTNLRATARPSRTVVLEPAARPPVRTAAAGGLSLWGHAHLDVAWLWTYDEAKRKAMRTFAGAVSLLEDDPSFIFIQSQPQLYAFVRDQDRDFFDRVAGFVREGRFDADVAAMWVEPDCNLPSGESLLRQMLAAHRFCSDAFGVEPSILWLPDTFGFARTLPTLMAHAGIPYFATTKLQWNDTTKFPHPQFRWRGPDGSEVVSAMIHRMEGGCGTLRVRAAHSRQEPLVIGYGDGGGGPTRAQLAKAPEAGRWERPREWFARLTARKHELPVHDDELYLEYHRGVYTTHHDVKALNARLERRLRDVEEQAAWCVAIGVPAQARRRVHETLTATWEIVLRNQFHDVLPGTSIAPVYEDAHREYARAGALLDEAETMLRAMLPRPAQVPSAPAPLPPACGDDDWVFENRYLRARVRPTGTVVELTPATGGNVVASANLLALYRDRPKRWEAWNLDAGYDGTRRAAKPGAPQLRDGAMEIPFQAGSSLATMRVSLAPGEAFLRVDLAIDWRARRRLLRHENWLAIATGRVLYGAPHGTIWRSARADSSQARARFEVPGQRFAAVGDESGLRFAALALDTYGWSARALGRGGVRLGHSLLRATTWPDPHADRGEHQFSWAYAPLDAATPAAVERLWERFAGRSGVRLFESETPSVLVVACKPAENGDGAIVRVRECDGTATVLRLRCGGRMRAVEPVDGLERQCGGDAGIDGETLVASIGGYAIRAFRVRF
jgi:alpha-mannosidase